MEGSQISLPLALLAVLLLASSFSTAESRLLHRIDHRRRFPVPPVCNVCRRAEFPRLCESFVPEVRTVTADSVIEATVQAAISRAQVAKALADKLMDSPSTDSEVKGGLDMCRQNFEMLVLDLQKVLENLKGTGSRNDLMSNLSAALADIDSCDESFNESPGRKSPVSHLTSNLRKLALNSLSLADDFN
ncbi:putative pectinesterase/pectinesterase inhibitor 26 [Cocos nucifera]|uniref:Putative pectinesterase/pectinesterase inhibitor 26 n=1 Tax=Cocos nucifera TaxID=13894 RepID=A0A8K0IB12_COCNU|nr:putative pectinesterase/pectinesterase inhibitor 26 [Cocos nucifera]